MCVIIFMWWYLDHVIADNRGVAYNFYFMFQKKYWLDIIPNNFKNQTDYQSAKKGKVKRPYSKADIGMGVTEDQTFNSAELEKQRVIENEENDVYVEGLRIVNIGKVYSKLPFGLKSKKDVYAVNGIYLDIAKNELLCLLGHNGAGKSTLFNMMTGIIAPTSGEAKICGLDI